MQNKPNLVRRRRIANSVCTRNYEIFIPLAGQKNKPNTNPIKPNLKRAKMNVNSFRTKDYRKKDDFAVRKNKPNSKPILSAVGGFQMNANAFSQKDYENETAFRPQKNKPNSKPVLSLCPRCAVEWANIETARRGQAKAGRICQNGTKIDFPESTKRHPEKYNFL